MLSYLELMLKIKEFEVNANALNKESNLPCDWESLLSEILYFITKFVNYSYLEAVDGDALWSRT